MLKSSIDSLNESRAKFARNVEYLKETALDDMIDERTEMAESQFVGETMEELQEALEMVNDMTIDSDTEVALESEEVQRILDAENNITFNEMIGLD